MKNLHSLLILIFSLVSVSVSANSINGKVTSDQGEAIFYANVILFNQQDSSIVDMQYSEEDGTFVMENLASGNYWLECRYIGYPDIIVNDIVVNGRSNLDLGELKFEAPANELEEVTVTAKRPILEMKPDKIVLNVEGSINSSGSDAFTLLRQSPGVVIDNSDNIFMLGKGGVQIYIDGKPSPLNGTDLVEYLKTIQSSEIESIEIITQPSSKYDAEGNAGIINIKFRRDKNLGTSGSVNMSRAQGIRHGNNASLRLTNRTKKFNSYGSISLYDGENYNPFNLYRVQSGVVFDQSALGNSSYKGINFRAGTDLYLSKKSTIGVLWSGYTNEGMQEQESNTSIFKDGTSQTDSILFADNVSEWDRHNHNINLNYKYNAGEGKVLNVDLDYGVFDNQRYEDQPNSYLSADRSEVLSEINFANDAPNNIKIATVKADYEQPAWGGQLGIGFKLSRVLTDNTFNFYNVVDGDKTLDSNRSNHFEYDEDVNAVYVNFNRTFGDLSLNGGLRVEHTHSIGELTAMIPSDNERVERDYVDFFPSLGLSYKLDDANSFRLSYSRRLNRPSYNDLNPFRMRLDELTFEQGNPFLNPEYATSFQLSHSWNYKLTTTVSYSHTKDMIARLTDVEGDRYAFITWKNIADQYAYSLNMAAPIPITQWWNSYSSVTGTHTKNRADFGEGKFIDLSVTTFNVYSQHSFNLPGAYMLELSGWYNSPSIWEGNFKMEAMYSVDLGVQKSFLDNKLKLRLNVSDIFKTQTWQGVTTFGSQFIDASGSWDSRRVRLNVSYKFGNNNVKASKRKTGLEAEKSRVKSNN